MKQVLTSMIVYSAFAATLVFAQTPPPGPMRTPPSAATVAQRQVQRLATLLDLTATQQGEAQTIFQTAATTALSVSSSMQTARKALRAAVLANDTSNGAAGIPTAASTIGSLTTTLVQAEAVAQAAFYQLLTPAQQTKYNLLGQRGGMGGPGPMGPGPGGMGQGGMGGQGLRGGQ